MKKLYDGLKADKDSLLKEIDSISKKLEWYKDALKICQEENKELERKCDWDSRVAHILMRLFKKLGYKYFIEVNSDSCRVTIEKDDLKITLDENKQMIEKNRFKGLKEATAIANMVKGLKD